MCHLNENVRRTACGAHAVMIALVSLSFTVKCVSREATDRLVSELHSHLTRQTSTNCDVAQTLPNPCLCNCVCPLRFLLKIPLEKMARTARPVCNCVFSLPRCRTRASPIWLRLVAGV